MTYIVTYYDEKAGKYHQVHVDAPSADAAAWKVEARDDCTRVCVVAEVRKEQAEHILKAGQAA